jgi:hypothetical protein
MKCYVCRNVFQYSRIKHEHNVEQCVMNPLMRCYETLRSCNKIVAAGQGGNRWTLERCSVVCDEYPAPYSRPEGQSGNNSLPCVARCIAAQNWSQSRKVGHYSYHCVCISSLNPIRVRVREPVYGMQVTSQGFSRSFAAGFEI